MRAPNEKSTLCWQTGVDFFSEVPEAGTGAPQRGRRQHRGTGGRQAMATTTGTDQQPSGTATQVRPDAGGHPRRGPSPVPAAGLRPDEHPVGRRRRPDRPVNGDALLRQQAGPVRCRRPRRPPAAQPLSRPAAQARAGTPRALRPALGGRPERRRAPAAAPVGGHRRGGGGAAADGLPGAARRGPQRVVHPPDEAVRRAGSSPARPSALRSAGTSCGYPASSDRPAADLVADLAPTIQRYLTGPLPATSRT